LKFSPNQKFWPFWQPCAAQCSSARESWQVDSHFRSERTHAFGVVTGEVCLSRGALACLFARCYRGWLGRED
jgi:hypothetical protein